MKKVLVTLIAASFAMTSLAFAEGTEAPAGNAAPEAPAMNKEAPAMSKEAAPKTSHKHKKHKKKKAAAETPAS